jgi:hypothetical protein
MKYRHASSCASQGACVKEEAYGIKRPKPDHDDLESITEKHYANVRAA